MAKTLLALDSGTQSVRALLFDLDGNLLGRSQVHFDPVYQSPVPGAAEQDANYYWQSLCQACEGLWAQGVDRSAIAGVSVTTQRGTVVALDRAGQPLRPAITWLDQREAERLTPMPLRWQALFRALGEQEAVEYFRRQAECNYLEAHEPAVWAKTEKFLLLSGFLTWKLSGEFRDAISSQVGYLPFDFKRLRWAKPWDWKWQALSLKASQLPELVSPARMLGRITAEAARETGIPEGLPLIAAGADKACEVLGSGSLSPDVGALSFGTTATINTTRRRYTEVVPLLPPYPAAVPGAFCTEVQTQRGFWMVNWFKEEFGFLERELAKSQGCAPELLFDQLLHQTPPGAMGLMLQPYWSPGIREPGREAKGALIGFGDVHTRAHVYRAIIEGLAYALREGREKIERRTGSRIRSLRVSGGGSQSDAVMQITADVFNVPAERPHTFETSGLGAAINIAVGLGLHPDHETAVGRMVRVGARFEPHPQHARLYDQLYRRVYSPLYERLQPLYREIRQITGYPR